MKLDFVSLPVGNGLRLRSTPADWRLHNNSEDSSRLCRIRVTVVVMRNNVTQGKCQANETRRPDDVAPRYFLFGTRPPALHVTQSRRVIQQRMRGQYHHAAIVLGSPDWRGICDTHMIAAFSHLLLISLLALQKNLKSSSSSLSYSVFSIIPNDCDPVL
ncbi:hypothetical protein ASPZODRAFT_1304749 [Penicilliopsis zonata CBS 506.65]|uniref:Uncharacterized protein n=1 Tax=Penicilliopsis zonata CBS 506.65 TaxID=1073090 RepID=A0A1L9S5Y3_9EURO|nr:hypothetical protein ASPZODRAFT_1304749 [Penicilliopsis zonata CBS 506.65]OJJ42555.1 hypothetical protein ASPZODRAFT_1304749 [Penicilliopsis zonata CBS 506.65]